MERWRLLTGIIGGLLVHFVIGTVYITGNISVYLVSYMRVQGEEVTLQDAVVILPLQILSSTPMVYCGAQLSARFGTRGTVLLGNSLAILATFCGSFCTSFWSFCFVYAVGFGMGDGISYITPLIMGWSYFPQHKGRITGMVLFCFALGTTVFGLVSTAIINPDNKKADVIVSDGVTTDYYYSAEIANGFPAMMRWLSLCYLCLTILAVSLIIPIRGSSPNQSSSQPDDSIMLPSVKAAVSHPIFWLLFSMGATLPLIASVKPLFFIWICGSMVCQGGQFSLFPAVTAKIFGKAKGGTVYSLLFYTFSISSLIGFGLQYYIVKVSNRQKIGYGAMIWILSGASVVSLALLLGKFKEESPWKEEKKKFIPFVDFGGDAGQTEIEAIEE